MELVNKWRRAFYNKTYRLPLPARLSVTTHVSKRKRVWIGRIVSGGRRETKWSTLARLKAGQHQLETRTNKRWEKLLDELRVGVKTNQTWNGLPRNAFRCSLAGYWCEVERLIRCGASPPIKSWQTPNASVSTAGVRAWVLRSVPERRRIGPPAKVPEMTAKLN